jgi:lipopolysaccharide/colanic/teichoic acid biosynthesis glycosyltransferase
VCDVTLAIVCFVLFSPILLIAALAVKLTTRGPAFYSQIRLGERGRRFRFYKLRTVSVVAEIPSAGNRALADVRVTPVGRFLRQTHIDELPQFWNVIRGDMSVVGPRPERQEIAPILEKEIPNYSERLQSPQGLTGLSQVLLPPGTNVESAKTKAKIDAYYVRHTGPWLDVRILFATFLVGIGFSGATAGRILRLPKPAAIDEGT